MKTKEELLEEIKNLRSLLTEKEREEEVFNLFIDGTFSLTGEEFMRSLVGHLASVLKFRYAFVGEVINEAKDEVRTLAVWADGDFTGNVEYKLYGTPCQNVIEKSLCHYPENIQQSFPEDHLLKEMGVESYIGIPLFDSTGDVLGILAAMDDKPTHGAAIAKSIIKKFAIRAGAELERKRAEGKIRNYQNNLETIINSSSDTIFLKDTNFRYIIANKTHERHFHTKVENIIGKTNFDFMPEELATECRKSDEAALRSSDPVDIEEHAWGMCFHTVKQRVIDVDGNIVGIVGIIRDITLRKQVEEALRRSEANLAEAQRMAHLGSYELNISDNKVRQSEENYRIFGVTPEEFDGSFDEFLNIVHPDDREFVKESMHRALYERVPYCIDFRIIRPDGTERIVHDQAEVTYNESGQPVQIIGTVQDITECKRIEDELLKAQKLESLGILAGGIAHDFNNFLTGIMGNIYLAKLSLSPRDKIFGILTESEKASLQAKDLAKQLLTFAKGGEPVKKTTSIGELIKDWCSFTLRGTKARHECLIPDDLWPVEIEKGQIHQVINNLIINAVQAMTDGGQIKVQAENIIIDVKEIPTLNNGRYVKITIEDLGTGIPEGLLPKIFDPFFTTKETGSGLGLAIAYSIIKKHTGHISVESEVGVGTAFCVYLPASGKKVFKEQDTEKAAVSGSGRVLIIDDEETIRDFVCTTLRHFGYEAEPAGDGAEGLDLYKKAIESGHPFNAVIMDLTIPGGMSGKEAIKELLKIDPGAKVIVSSGYSKDPIMTHYEEYGFRDVLVKPYIHTRLCEVVNRVLG